MSAHPYSIRYSIIVKPNGFAKGDAGPDDGLTDAIVLASIVNSGDGSSSTMWMSKDGLTGAPLSGRRLAVQAWGPLTKLIADDPTMPPELQKLARETFEALRKLIVK